MNEMTIITSWDDGHENDLRIADLLLRYKLEGIFFIPNFHKHLQLTKEDLKELAQNFEIGGHTVSHPEDLKRLSNFQVEMEIASNKRILEEITGKTLEWFCYPGGRYNEQTIGVVKNCGYKYARTTFSNNTDLPKDLYRIRPTIQASKKKYNEDNWLETAKQLFLEAQKKKGYFHLWGHSYEVGEENLWNELEELFKFIYANKN